jgi:hypothetical protein
MMDAGGPQAHAELDLELFRSQMRALGQRLHLAGRQLEGAP